MIITNVCLLLEMLSIVICLHHLYGVRMKLDIETVSLLAIDMIMMQAIDFWGLSSVWSVFIYPLIILYCGRKFGYSFKIIGINISLCVILIGFIQMLMTYVFCYWLNIVILVKYELLTASVITFLIVLCILPKCSLHQLSLFLQEKERLLVVTMIVCMAAVLIWLVGYKLLKVLEAYQAIIVFCCMILILLLSAQLGKYKIKAKEIETELKMHQLFADSFQGLIEHIRLRQHEFDNHINAIYSQHYTYRTYEELVNAQKSYCQLIVKENRFNKLLSNGSPVIIGFLYGKFVEIDKMNIDITYRVNIREMEIGVPVYKIVEVLGNLINNAVEALEGNEEARKLYVCVEQNDNFIIEVGNESPYIDYAKIENFFKKGYSKKGENRGLGLYHVKKICDEYKMQISCENRKFDGENWLVFQVIY